MLDFEKLIYNDINKEETPVLINFEYSNKAEDIESFLLYDLSEDDVPEDDEIQSIDFDLYIFNMDNFKVECTLHGAAGITLSEIILRVCTMLFHGLNKYRQTLWRRLKLFLQIRRICKC